MLTEDQKKHVLVEMQKFAEKLSGYIEGKSELNQCEKNIKAKTEELLKVAEEERQMETALEVIYRQAKKESKTRKIEEERESWRQKSEILRKELDELRTDLLELMRNLPIPVDLENPKEEEAGIAFPFFEETELGKDGINVMCDLLRQGPPLDFLDVSILPDKVIIKDVSQKQEAVSKLIEGIRSFRMHVDYLLKSYEQIDEMVERLRRSEQYARVLMILAEKDKLTTDQIARMLSMDRRRVYDTCYNLTRSNWSPNPIKISSGEWQLTLPGEILVNRLIEKYGTSLGEKKDLPHKLTDVQRKM